MKLRKHKNALTVLSAFIVFVSFMVKEGWDEHLKDLTAAIHSAEDEARRTDESEKMFDLLSETDQRVWLLSRKFIEAREEDSAKWRKTREFEMGRASYDVILSHLRQVEILQNLLWNRAHYSEEVKRLGAKNRALNQAYYDLPEETEKPIKNQASMSDVIAEQWYLLEKEAEKLAKDAHAEIAKRLEWNEKYHRVCTWCSYLLFALGWGLGLVSNLGGASAKTKAD